METTGFKVQHKTVVWIPVKELSVIWVQSQRPFNKNLMTEIINGFDPDMFGELAVTEPNEKGIRHIIDGQHRKAAVQQMFGDSEKVPCRVIAAATPARAAAIFDGISRVRKGLSQVESFEVRLTAGYEPEVPINDIVKAAGFYISAAKVERGISAVGMLKLIFSRYGERVLVDTLELVQKTFGPDSGATTGSILGGFAMVIAQFPSLNRKRLIEQIGKKHTPSHLIGASKALREFEGGRAAENVQKIIIGAYNSGLHESNKLQIK